MHTNDDRSPAAGAPVKQPAVRPLPKTQRELLEAMQQGVRVVYQPYMGLFNPQAHYFRSDNHKRVTAAANALLEKGLAKRAMDGRTYVLIAAA